MRRIDARSLRGLAHPLRMDILEALELDGPATSTTLSARLGENTGTISWHLRLLAEHGYIEEDVERGTRRERWWRIPGRTVLDPGEFRDDPETSGALDVYLRHLVERYYDRVRTYVDEDWPAEWQSAAALSDWRDLHLTPDQLQALNEELAEVITRYTTATPTGPNPERVIIQLQSFPRRSTPPTDQPASRRSSLPHDKSAERRPAAPDDQSARRRSAAPDDGSASRPDGDPAPHHPTPSDRSARRRSAATEDGSASRRSSGPDDNAAPRHPSAGGGESGRQRS